MLRDSGKTTMNLQAKTASKPEKPVMLCRLCHCEFTNFKEHVKSLVHLDARETKSTSAPPSKHKSTSDNNDYNHENAKRTKKEPAEEKSSSRERNDHNDKFGRKESHVTDSSRIIEEQSGNQVYSPTTAYLEDELSNLSGGEDNSKGTDLNGSSTAKLDNEDEPHLMISARDLKEFARNCGLKLTDMQTSSLIRTWRCKLCAHIHQADDQSFDEHAKSKDHRKALDNQLSSMKESFKLRSSYKWLMNCLACSFLTNDKDLFISHVQSEEHDKNLSAILGNIKSTPYHGRRCTCINRTSGHTSEQPVSNKVSNVQENNKATLVTRSKTSWKPATPEKSAATTPMNRKITPAKTFPKASFPKPFIEKSQVGSNVVKSVPVIKNHPAPLMSLSLPDALSQNQSSWNTSSTVTRNSPSLPRNPPNKPGILGEYRPPIGQTSFAFDTLKPKNPFDLIGDSMIGARSVGESMIGARSVGVPAGRPAYPEVDQGSFSGMRKGYEVDSYGGGFGSDKYASAWSGRNDPHQTEKLNPIAFGRTEPDPPMSEFDTLSKLFTQQPGLLPSNVSLDLASNSSIRFKCNSDRAALFDNYPTPRPDPSRSDFLRHNLPRTHSSRDDVLSREDLYSRTMFTRR